MQVSTLADELKAATEPEPEDDAKEDRTTLSDEGKTGEPNQPNTDSPDRDSEPDLKRARKPDVESEPEVAEPKKHR